MANSLKKKLSRKWRILLLRFCESGPPSIEPSILKQQFLPLLCVGSSSCKGYIIALHQLTSPRLLRILADAAAHYDYNASRALAISCEPHTFEATFCLLQRSSKGLIHIPLSRSSSSSSGVC